MRGKRTIWGGRAKVRSALYMAALVASRHNSVLAVFYQRLVSAGKAKKLAITAVMRKLLTILNAIIRDSTTLAKRLTNKTVAHPTPLPMGEGADPAQPQDFQSSRRLGFPPLSRYAQAKQICSMWR